MVMGLVMIVVIVLVMVMVMVMVILFVHLSGVPYAFYLATISINFVPQRMVYHASLLCNS